MGRIYVYRISLPMSVKGSTTQRNGDHIIFINADYCEECQAKALKHEMRHIEQDHFSDMLEIRRAEFEAG